MIDNENIIEAGQRYGYLCDATKVWEAGSVAIKTVAADGVTPMVQPSTGASGDNIVGLFWGNKTNQLTEQVYEEVRFVDPLNNPTASKQLSGTSITTAAVRVTSVDGATEYVVGGGNDYTITAGGVITRTGGSDIPAGGTVVVAYEKKLTAEELAYRGVDYNRGSDDSLGFVPGFGGGQVTVVEGHMILPTDQYEAAVTYPVGAKLYVSSRGRLTTTPGTKRFPGTVHTGPSASYRWLIVDALTPNDAVS